MKSKSALIVGGGIIGVCCALRLQQQGFAVTLIDFDNNTLTPTLGNAGHLAVEQIEPLSSVESIKQAWRRLFIFGGALSLPLEHVSTWAPFAIRFIAASRPRVFSEGKRALEAWLREAMPAWRRMASAVGAEGLLAESGHFVVWEKEPTAARGRSAWALQRAASAAHRSALSSEREEIAKLLTSPIADIIWFERTGHIRCLKAMHESIVSAFMDAGGKRICARVRSLEIEYDRAQVRLDDESRYDADVVLIAAGVDSGRILREIGHSAPIIAERGYHIDSSVMHWPDNIPPIVFADRDLIVTRFRNSLRIASFVELGRADADPDTRKFERLRKHARELGLPLMEPLREWMGARPTLPDYRPAIGRSRYASNLMYAFGHQHLGLTLAPVTAEVVAQLAEGKTPDLPVKAFDLGRFDGQQDP